MNSSDPQIVDSRHSRVVTGDGISVELCIYRLDTGKEWSMELVTEDGSSIVWEKEFESDDAANAEFDKALGEEGLYALVNDVEEATIPEL